jgi:hypothetical protein
LIWSFSLFLLCFNSFFSTEVNGLSNPRWESFSYLATIFYFDH